MILSLALAATFCAPMANAENTEVHKVKIVYSVIPDNIYGSPGVTNPAETQETAAGKEFVLAESLKTDSIMAVDPLTDDIYIGKWVFSGWVIPDHVCTREIEKDTEELFDEEYSTLIEETEKEIICTSLFDAEIKGSWQFIPQEKLQTPDKIEGSDALPLSGNYDALSKFWPQREAALNMIYATGLFPESIIKCMNDNIAGVPLMDSAFGSVALSDMERATFLNAVRSNCEAMMSVTGASDTVNSAIGAIIAASSSGNAGADTAFVTYCAEKAGLLDGKSRSMIKTADIDLLYSFLKDDACADILTTDDLLQIYRTEDGNVTSEISINGTSVVFAHSANWYDVSNKKNTIQPGDLIFFKDELDKPVRVGIIGAVEERSISYVICTGIGTLEEKTLDESYVLKMSMAGARAEIIGLRSCDSSRIIYEFLKNELKLPESSALSIMGNMYYESGFSTTSLGDGNTSFGLCQWHNDRFLNLVIFCIKNNYNIASLEGQLRFLAYELEENYPGLLNELRQCGTSAAWAREAARRFCQVFEQPANLTLNAALRGNIAAGALWDDFSELFLSTAQIQSLKLSQLEDQRVAEEQSEYLSYKVKRGDTLSAICLSLGIDYSSCRLEIIKLNNLANEDRIYEGQNLIFLRREQNN